MKTFTLTLKGYILLVLTLMLSTSVFAQYCASNGNNTNDEFIGRFQFNTIDNSSGVGTTSTGYSNFTAISTNVDLSTNYTFTITPTWTGSTYPEGYAIWIDYNQDNDFNDAGELVYTRSATTTSPITSNFTIPGSATLGSTRMRVSMKYNGPIEAPINKDDVLAKLVINYNGDLLSEHDLLSSQNINRKNIISRILNSINYLIWGDV